MSIGASDGSIMPLIMTAHMAHSRTRCGPSHTPVIIHALAPVIGPYMSRDMTTIHAQQTSGRSTRAVATGHRRADTVAKLYDPGRIEGGSMALHVTGDVLIACNCDYGCPCNFNARPSRGFCEGGWVWMIEKGQVDDVDVSGLATALFAKW